MKDGIHFSNLFVSLKVFCEGLLDPPLISKLTKNNDNVRNNVTIKFNKVFLLENRF